MREYINLEQHIIGLFNNCQQLNWNNNTYDEVKAAKPITSSGECKTDVYVSLRKAGVEVDSLKISVKKDNAEFMGNKLTASDAENLLGSDWQSILIESIGSIKTKFVAKDIFYLRPKSNPADIFFTLGWKLEIANKSRRLSAPLALNDQQIIDRVYRGTQQPDYRKNALVDKQIIPNSGVADYLLQGSVSSFSDINSVLSNLTELNTSTFSSPDIHLIFTANNYRIMANKADGPRSLAVAISWQTDGNIIKPTFIFDSPLAYKGETDMMPLIKQSLANIGIPQNTYQRKDVDLVALYNKIANHLQFTS